MKVTRTQRKAPITRPKKKPIERRRREATQRKRLVAMGASEESVKKMTCKQLREELKKLAKKVR